MKLPEFTLLRPGDESECLALLAEHGDDASLLSGGQSLLPLMATRISAPELLIDIGRLDGLAVRYRSDDVMVVGSRIRHQELLDDPFFAVLPILPKAARHIGHRAIRNRGTFGGSLAHADPAAELPAVAVLLGAALELKSVGRGSRTVAARDFFHGPFFTARESDELLAAVRLSRPPAHTRFGFYEFVARTGDFASAGAGVSAVVDPVDGTVRDPRVVLFGVPGSPIDLGERVASLAGATVDDDLPMRLALAALPRTGASPVADDDEADLARVCVRRAFEDAFDSAIHDDMARW